VRGSAIGVGIEVALVRWALLRLNTKQQHAEAFERARAPNERDLKVVIRSPLRRGSRLQENTRRLIDDECWIKIRS
jgi:hypothetical protein